MWTDAQEHVRNTRRRLENSIVFVQTHQQGLADENDLQCFTKELNKTLTTKVRGGLGGVEGDLKGITLLTRIGRHERTMNGWTFLE